MHDSDDGPHYERYYMNIGKTTLPDGMHGEGTKRTLSRYDGVVCWDL